MTSVLENRWLLFAAVGIELGFSVIAGIVLGSYIDEWVGTSDPYFTVIGLIAGVITGFTFLIRILKMRDERKK